MSLEIKFKDLNQQVVADIYRIFCEEYNVGNMQDTRLAIWSALECLRQTGSFEYSPIRGTKFLALKSGEKVDFWGYVEKYDLGNIYKDKQFVKSSKKYLATRNISTR
jgi:hypothetical protein